MFHIVYSAPDFPVQEKVIIFPVTGLYASSVLKDDLRTLLNTIFNLTHALVCLSVCLSLQDFDSNCEVSDRGAGEGTSSQDEV